MASSCFDRYKTPKSSTNKDWSAPFLIQLVMLLIFTINRETDIILLCGIPSLGFEFEFCFSSHLCQLWLIRD